MARRQRRYAAQQWADLIREQQASGDPIDVFCARKRIGTSTFGKWRRRFEDRWNAAVTGATPEPSGSVEALPPLSAVVSLVFAEGIRLDLPMNLLDST